MEGEKWKVEEKAIILTLSTCFQIFPALADIDVVYVPDLRKWYEYFF
jgi:hypothetical protein